MTPYGMLTSGILSLIPSQSQSQVTGQWRQLALTAALTVLKPIIQALQLHLLLLLPTGPHSPAGQAEAARGRGNV